MFQKKKQNLIQKTKVGYSGTLLTESSAIINWILSSSDERLQKYIVEYNINVPSLSETFNQTKYHISPMTRWIEEETCPGKPSFVGFKNQQQRDQREQEFIKALFPAYINWCERNGYLPLTHISFTDALLLNCPQAKKVRKGPGMFIEGIVLQPKVFDFD